MLECPSSPTTNIHVLLLYESLLDGIYHSLYSSKHCGLVNSGLLGYNLYQFNLSHFRYTFVLFCKMCSKNPAKVHKDLPLHKF